MDGAVLVVVGAKGGVGKTTTSLNLAAALADDERSVAVVEADLAMANVGDFLDVEVTDGGTLHDVLAGASGVGDATYRAPGGFDVVPSGTDLDGFLNANVDRLPGTLDVLKARYDVVIVDTGAGVNREGLVAMGLATASVLVSTPRLSSVRDADKTTTVAERAGTPVGGVVLTKSGTGRSPPAKHIADFLDVPLLGHVPHDEAIPNSQDAGQPVVEHAPGCAAATAYRRVAEALKQSGLLAETLSQEAGGFRFDEPDGAGAAADGGRTGDPYR